MQSFVGKSAVPWCLFWRRLKWLFVCSSPYCCTPSISLAQSFLRLVRWCTWTHAPEIKWPFMFQAKAWIIFLFCTECQWRQIVSSMGRETLKHFEDFGFGYSWKFVKVFRRLIFLLLPCFCISPNRGPKVTDVSKLKTTETRIWLDNTKTGPCSEYFLSVADLGGGDASPSQGFDPLPTQRVPLWTILR